MARKPPTKKQAPASKAPTSPLPIVPCTPSAELLQKTGCLYEVTADPSTKVFTLEKLHQTEEVLAAAEMPRPDGYYVIDQGDGPAPVRVVERDFDDARELVTVDYEDPIWSAEDVADGVVAFRIRHAKGAAIVRLRPPAVASDARIAEVKAAFEQWARVLVVPRPKASAVPREEAAKIATTHETARQAVLALVDVANVEDRTALREFCEKTMAEEGL